MPSVSGRDPWLTHCATIIARTMSNPKQIVEPTFEEALVDIQTLAQFALEGGDKAIMTRDLEMILTIAEMMLDATA